MIDKEQKELYNVHTRKSVQKKGREKMNKKLKSKKVNTNKGITLIALIITTIFSYDEKLKCSNYNGFLLETI